MLCLTFRIGTIQCFCIADLANLCLAATDRTDFWNIFHTTSCQILCNLRNDHIRLINFNFIPHTKFQFFHNTDVMDTSTAHCRSLQLHRFKDSDRIDESCSRWTPLNLQKLCLADLISPFKCK